MKKFMDEFKEFISKGNVMDMAVGLIIGGAFTTIVTALNEFVLSPIIGMLCGGINFDSLVLTVGSAELQYGKFLTAVVNFLITAFALFCIVKAMNTVRDRLSKKKEEAPAEEPKPDPQIVLLTQIRDLLEKDASEAKTISK